MQSPIYAGIDLSPWLLLIIARVLSARGELFNTINHGHFEVLALLLIPWPDEEDHKPPAFLQLSKLPTHKNLI